MDKKLSGSTLFLRPLISVSSWYFPRLLQVHVHYTNLPSSVPYKTRGHPPHAMHSLMNFTKSLQGNQHSGPFLHELCILSFSHGPCPVLSVGDPEGNKTHLCPQGAHTKWRDISKALIRVFYASLCGGRSECSGRARCLCSGTGGILG